MAKTLFDISATTEPIEWQQCRLIMEVGPHIFSWIVLGPGRELLRMRVYEPETNETVALGDALEDIINNDEVLQQPVRESVVIYNFPESDFVPEQYFNINVTAGLIELMHGDLNRGIILSEKIAGTGQYNVFRVPGDIHGLFQRRFQRTRYWHYYSLWMECRQRQGTGQEDDSLSVIFYPRCILVSFVRQGKVQLFRSFAYEAAEDVSYYLLNLCDRFDAPAETIAVHLSGMLEESSTLCNEIYKYFGAAMVEPFGAAASMPALQEYPEHFFSPLLKLAVCV